MPKLSCNWRRRRWARGVLAGLSENRAIFVVRDDVAAAAGILIGDGHAGAIYKAAGPLRPVGCGMRGPYRRNHWSAARGRVITEQRLRAGLTQASLPTGAVNTVVGIQASFAACVFDIVTGDVERLGGRPPKLAPREACGGTEISPGLKARSQK